MFFFPIERFKLCTCNFIIFNTFQTRMILLIWFLFFFILFFFCWIIVHSRVKMALISAAASESFDYSWLKYIHSKKYCSEFVRSHVSFSCDCSSSGRHSGRASSIQCRQSKIFVCVHIQFNYNICAFRSLFFPSVFSHAYDTNFHKYVEFIVIAVEIYVLVLFRLSHRQIKFEYIFTLHTCVLVCLCFASRFVLASTEQWNNFRMNEQSSFGD